MPQSSPTITDDLLIGFVLADKYRVIRQIGRGGMGVVYEAEHVQLGKRVAIKLMLEKYAEDNEAIARFQREALAASRIGNPHIIDVSDIGVAPDGRSFVVMEYLDGAPLSNVLEATGPMPVWRAISIMRQVLRAVGAAHAKGIIHRDLKPDNIFLINQDDHHDFVKLLDFGISKIIDFDEASAPTKLTTTGVVIGTPLYMAPEQAMGNPIDRYADIYACGTILYEMLSGHPPFEGATYAVLVAKLITTEPPPLAGERSGLPRQLVDAVHRALDKEPTKRFSSAEAFSAALPGERSQAELELAGTLDSGRALAVAPMPSVPNLSTPNPTGRTASATRWSRLAMMISALVLGIGATAAVILLVKDSGATAEPARPTANASGVTIAPIEEPAPEPSKPAAPATVGRLSIKSSPGGAAVTVDGQPSGNTPVTVTLSRGPHDVRVELAGHAVMETSYEIEAGKDKELFAPLAKLTAETPSPPSKAAPPPVRRNPPKRGGPGPTNPYDETKPAAGTKPNPYALPDN